MAQPELSDWFVAAAYRVARYNRLGTNFRTMPEGSWRKLLDAVDTLARGSEERIPIDWRNMLAVKLGREPRRPDGFGP